MQTHLEVLSTMMRGLALAEVRHGLTPNKNRKVSQALGWGIVGDPPNPGPRAKPHGEDRPAMQHTYVCRLLVLLLARPIELAPAFLDNW